MFVAWAALSGLRGDPLAQTGPPTGRRAILSVYEENDLIMNTDRHYTQGLKIHYLGAEKLPTDQVGLPFNWMPAVFFEPETVRLGFELGQNIFTPGDIESPALLESERPYAGWLYAGMTLQRRGTSLKLNSVETLSLDLGILGPHALGREAQNYVHEIRGFELAQGWDHQIDTEPGVALRYHRAWRWAPIGRQGLGLDLMPHTGFSLGNIDTSVRLGGAARVGWNLPDDFGVRTVDSLTAMGGGRTLDEDAHPIGVYAFTLWEGRAVGYTAFLDGNLFNPSHQVDKNTLVAEWKSGVALVFRRFEVGITHVYRTREFVNQSERDRFGSVWIKWKF